MFLRVFFRVLLFEKYFFRFSVVAKHFFWVVQKYPTADPCLSISIIRGYSGLEGYFVKIIHEF